ncbi:unnamed protein product [Owenia fusiformis]|uniref:Uncharacterized protein n=1 Tax=Owenia fusiformis TaxID=6347 RepID=A0A8J1YCN7_OWEFU|nr:unnamed protein product [Owenia fusiformis]
MKVQKAFLKKRTGLVLCAVALGLVYILISKLSTNGKYKKASIKLEEIWGSTFSKNSTQLKDIHGTPSENKQLNDNVTLNNESRGYHPLNSIYFLKIHKTGSSTLQSILQRYGDIKNLSFALHASSNQLEYPQLFKKNFTMTLKAPYSRYDIICHHLRHSDEVFDVLKPEGKAITMLRKPTYNFISAFKYFDYWSKNCFGTHNIDKFLSTIESSTYKLTESGKCANRQLYDLGMEPTDAKNVTKVQKKIQEMDRMFDLVMISEYFNEGLILLKHLMNWSFDDIVYISKNVQAKKTTGIDVTYPKAYRKIRELNMGDEILYQYYNKTFWNIINDFGRERMNTELSQFNQVRDKIQRYCIEEEVNGTNKKLDQYNNPTWVPHKVNAYLLSKEGKDNATCRQLVTYEIAYTDYLRQKMNSLGYV